MPSLSTYAVFLATAMALLAIPGPAVLYVVTRSIEMGRAGGVASVAGITTGTIVYVGLATAGLSSLILASRTAFDAVKYVGAAYLIVLGVRRLVTRTPDHVREEAAPRTRRRAYTQGVVVNLTNPKTIVFIFAFIPQFVDPNARHVWLQVLVLGLSFALLGFLSDNVYALAAGAVADRLRGSRKIARFERWFGGCGPHRARDRRGRLDAQPFPLIQSDRVFAADGVRRGNGASRLSESWGFFVGPTRSDHDQVQARVHLARRIRADAQPAQQDEDRRLRGDADARRTSALELRRQLDAAGGRLELGLLPAAGRRLPRPGTRERTARHVRGAAPGRDVAPVEQPRRRFRTTPGAWFGFEQEYFLYRDGAPLGFPKEGFPAPQGEYYTGVGYKNVGDVARRIVDEHIDLCLEAGINLEGINAEVAKGQWEFQIFGKGSKRAADELWIARYLLMRLCEQYGVDVNWHCKPLGAELDWNGSGLHTNFSTTHMREVGGEEYFEALMAAFDANKHDHIAVYGPDNHLRLTGLHETQSIDKFNYGVADRGASVRVPHSFVQDGYRGYLEDRRPNSLGDPYRIAGRILETIVTVPAFAEEAVAA